MIKRWFSHNVVLKLISFGLAIITWIYVNDQIHKH